MNDDNGHRVSPDDYRHSAPWNASYSYGEPDAHSSSTADSPAPKAAWVRWGW